MALVVVQRRWTVHGFARAPTVPPAPSLSRLPCDLLHHIARFMEASTLLTFEQVCRRTKRACDDDKLWRRLVLDRFGWLPNREPPSWRELYRYQHELFVAVVLRQASDALARMQMAGMGGFPTLAIPLPVM